jgi:fumarate hydratase class II
MNAAEGGARATRTERDSMGDMMVPVTALYGASTQRAVLNFPVSALRLPRSFVGAIGAVKAAAAKANMSLGLLDAAHGDAIVKAATEVRDGTFDHHFVVDVFQTGSGTSTNMNANEVIANRALEHLGKTRGDRGVVHPNDHVNMCQSSNDVFPTAIHVAAHQAVDNHLLPALAELQTALEAKAKEFATVIKMGRTHLQDATPIMLGQEFSGYAGQIQRARRSIAHSNERMLELALGGTAVGTGVNTHPEFAKRAVAEIAKETGAAFRETDNHFVLQASQDAAVELSGQLRAAAISLMKIANDLRWLASGPRGAIGEIRLPETQPGSSIMPAKVNPVICESVMMACAHIMGNDMTVAICGQHGNFELNVMMPALAYNLLESIDIMARAATNFVQRCVCGIEANEERCKELAEKSLATVTSLAPIIGYDKAGTLAKRALKEDKTVRAVARDMQVLPPDELERALDLTAMTKPGL